MHGRKRLQGRRRAAPSPVVVCDRSGLVLPVSILENGRDLITMRLALTLLTSVAAAVLAFPLAAKAQQNPQQNQDQGARSNGPELNWPWAINPQPKQTARPAPSNTPELNSGVSLSEIYDDNIFATRTDKTSDWITIINPFANLRLRGEKGEVNLGGSASIGRYATYSDENYNDYSVYTNGRYNFSPMLSVTGGAAYDHQHESRSSPDARQGVTPTIYNVTRAFGAALLKLDEKNSVRVGGTFDHFDYDNVAAIGGGTINNEDRDRDMVAVGTRVGHWLDKSNEVFGMFTFDSRDYRLPMDDYGYQKDSNGVRFSAGLHHRVSGTLDGEVYAGGIYQRYDDPRFGTVFVPDFGGQVRWTGLPGTTIFAKLERTIQETDVQGASGYVQTEGSVSVQHWIRPDLRVEGRASYALDKFDGISRTDQVQSYGIGIRNYVTPNFYIGADISRTTRDSSDPDYSYIDSRAMVTAGLAQEPAYKAEDFKKPEVPLDAQGRFFVGLQTGVGNLETKLLGSRGSTGTLQADFGDETWASSVFGGYGVYLGNWYLALEADVGKSTGGWDHEHVPNERVYSVERDWEYGLSGVIGRTFAGGTMLYGKAGVVAAQFNTDYQLNNRGTNDRRTEPGIRVGVGATAPITGNLAVRIEHTYSAFNSYNIDCCIAPPATGTPDNFTNDEVLNSFGLVYTFGGVPGAMTSADISYQGLYVGGQVGQDALSTWMTGPRDAGTTRTANFGDLGYTGGVFGGYGAQFGNFYVGGELEAELGKVQSNQERVGGGRSFAFEKQWSYGASLRGGYVVNNTALLYARVGVVQTRFNVDFSRGNNSLSSHYDETGLRFGGGMEFPVADNFIVRLDYTHTSYPQIEMVTPPSSEVEQFRPKDDLFRLGVLHQFAGQ